MKKNNDLPAATALGEWMTRATRERLEPGTTGRSTACSLSEASVEVGALVGFVLQRPRAWILAHPEQKLTAEQAARLNALLERLSAGEPLPYLTGRQEFYGLDFEVTPDVLIPRPETELLVEEALGWLREHPTARRMVDVGTGSGCIAASILTHCPRLSAEAVDVSQAALAVARRNAARHGVAERAVFTQGDLLDGLDGPFDLLCANLPYIPSGALASLPVTRYEPRLALDGGPDGLRLVAALVRQAPRALQPESLALFEIEAGQGRAAEALAREVFPPAGIHVLRDLAGHDRLLRIELGG